MKRRLLVLFFVVGLAAHAAEPKPRRLLAGAATNNITPEIGAIIVGGFIVPLAEGIYEYACTFPGHWVTMWGRLVVTSDPSSAVAGAVRAPPAAAAAGAAHGHPGK